MKQELINVDLTYFVFKKSFICQNHQTFNLYISKKQNLCLKRYFFYFPKITNNDVTSFDKLKNDLIIPKNDKQEKIAKS